MEFNLNNIPSQKGKIAIVTGANTGLGYETTLMFAQKGIKVIMACRNRKKAQKAKTEIEGLVPGAELEIMHVDLSNLSSVREFARQYREKYNKLDLLINNGGIMWASYSKTVDGFENTFATNYLSHFLLTSLLIDLMPDTSDSRIVTLSSNAHKMGPGKINFEDLQFEKKYNKISSYAQSKLACVMFSLELQRRLSKAGRKVLSVAAHPGFSQATDLIKGKRLRRFIKYSVGFLSHSPENGTMPTVIAALDPSVKGGEYYGPAGFMEMKGKPGKVLSTPYSRDAKTGKKLWEVTETLTGAHFDL